MDAYDATTRPLGVLTESGVYDPRQLSRTWTGVDLGAAGRRGSGQPPADSTAALTSAPLLAPPPTGMHSRAPARTEAEEKGGAVQ